MAKSTCHCPATEEEVEDPVAALMKGYERLQACATDSLLKKYLTEDVFEALKRKTTTLGATLLDCINSGLENLDACLGIYAADPESYCVFSDIFSPIINDCHGGFTKCHRHVESDWGDIMSITNLDPDNEFVISIRMSCVRSLDDYPFHPILKQEQYCEIEKKVSEAICGLPGELAGKYYSMCKLSECEIERMTQQGYLFKKGDKCLASAKANQFWPVGRGVYHNEEKTFVCWINSEDHLRVISTQCGGNFQAAYTRLMNGMKEVEARVKCKSHDRYGWITFNPINLGTGLRASVCIQVPNLGKQNEKIEEFATKYKVNICAKDESKGMFEVSTTRTLGVTEYEVIKGLHDAIAEMIKIERGS